MESNNRWGKPLETSHEKDWWTVFKYSYMANFEDKVYAGKIQNQSIIDDCYNMFEGDCSNELAGDLTREQPIKQDKSFIELFERELAFHINRITDNEVAALTFNESKVNEHAKRKYDDIWLNTMNCGDHNPLHNHSGVLSFVIYVDVDERIRQEHVNQKGNLPSRGLIEFVSRRTSEYMKINPKVGDILIFESEHQHQVYPFKTSTNRITIGGNIFGVEFRI